MSAQLSARQQIGLCGVICAKLSCGATADSCGWLGVSLAVQQHSFVPVGCHSAHRACDHMGCGQQLSAYVLPHALLEQQ